MRVKGRLSRKGSVRRLSKFRQEGMTAKEVLKMLRYVRTSQLSSQRRMAPKMGNWSGRKVFKHRLEIVFRIQIQEVSGKRRTIHCRCQLDVADPIVQDLRQDEEASEMHEQSKEVSGKIGAKNAGQKAG